MKTIFYYECYLNDLDYTGKSKLFGGFLFAKNYFEAVKQLEDFSEDELISIEKLYDTGVPLMFFEGKDAREIEHIFHERGING